MVNKNSLRKAQGLPLNTIVIAILVIIVLLVIILFFTGNFGKSNEQVGEITNDLNQCTTDNTLISSNGYTSATFRNTCQGGEDRISGITRETDTGSTEVCCASR